MSDKTLDLVLELWFRPNKCYKCLWRCLIDGLNNHSLLTWLLFQRTALTVHSTSKYYTLQRGKNLTKFLILEMKKKKVWKLVSSFFCQLTLKSEVKFHQFALDMKYNLQSVNTNLWLRIMVLVSSFLKCWNLASIHVISVGRNAFSG